MSLKNSNIIKTQGPFGVFMKKLISVILLLTTTLPQCSNGRVSPYRDSFGRSSVDLRLARNDSLNSFHSAEGDSIKSSETSTPKSPSSLGVSNSSSENMVDGVLRVKNDQHFGKRTEILAIERREEIDRDLLEEQGRQDLEKIQKILNDNLEKKSWFSKILNNPYKIAATCIATVACLYAGFSYFRRK